MTETKPGSSGHDEELLSDLLKHAERREQPRDEAKRAAYLALRDDWQSVVNRRAKRRRNRFIGIAASFLLVAAILWSPLERLQFGGDASEEFFGEVVLATAGDIYLNDDRLINQRASLRAGDRLATGSATRAAIRPLTGGSLRLDANTILVALSPARWRLESGAVYFDSQGSTAERLNIVTPLGSVQHIGTRYFARFEGAELTVGVREGRVRIERNDRAWETETGERITLTQTEERVEAIPTYGGDWDWVLEATPPRSLDAPQSAHDLVAWIARESGFEVSYETETAEQHAQEEELFRGLGSEVGPEQALETLRHGTDLQFTLDGGTLSISHR